MPRRLAHLPLHTGTTPPWLFDRMWRLAGAITMAVVDEFGPAEMLRRLSDPFWFQAFGCVLGFDWHSSGVTTVTCGALKEAYKHFGKDLGLLVAGGKGATSRKTPAEITAAAHNLSIPTGDHLVRASKLAAKVDSAALQDGHQLYHHSFFFTPTGDWCVVQQGMNPRAKSARRYHWLSESLDDFVNEPHHAIDDLTPDNDDDDDNDASPPCVAGELARRSSPDDLPLLNMVAHESSPARTASVDLTTWNPDKLSHELHKLTTGPTLFAPDHHAVLPSDVNVDRLDRTLRALHESHPADYATLLGSQNVGPATIRALSLLAHVIYNTPPSHRDPTDPTARLANNKAPSPKPTDSHPWASPDSWPTFSYAHGGKDGHPHPVDRSTYDHSIATLTDAVHKSRLGHSEKTAALKRLASHPNPLP